MNVRAIKSCRDITDDHINAAIESREDTRDLLEHAAQTSKPREGGARVLLVFAKIASPSCEWMDGALRLELRRNGEATVVESLADIGAGLKERVFPKMTFNVPLEEFLAAIKKFPQAIAPLTVESQSHDGLALVAGEAEKIIPSDDEPKPRLPTPLGLGVADLPTVGGPAIPLPIVEASAPAKGPPKPLAKLKLQRRALGHNISEEIVTKPVRDRRRDTGENMTMPTIEQLKPKSPAAEPEEKRDSGDKDVDTGWE